MTSRTYAGLLVLEDIYDYVPTNNNDIVNLANSVFTPNLRIVEDDCGTLLGNIIDVNFGIDGYVELATGVPITEDRINQLLFMGNYTVAVRSTSTCISSGGVCATCYNATFPRATQVSTNDRVVIPPEFVITTDILPGIVGSSSFNMSLSSEEYTYAYVYINGNLLTENVDYTITDQVLSLTNAMTKAYNLVIRYTAYNRAPFLIYLAEQYSGSLLGMYPLERPLLPVRSLLLANLLSMGIVNRVESYAVSNAAVPSSLSGYSPNINCPLEKSLYLLALLCVFSQTVN